MANWVRTLDIAYAWKQAKNEEITLTTLADIIAGKLKEFHLEGDFELQGIIDDFEILASDPEVDFASFNEVMDDLYNWADTPLDNEWNGKKNCWISTL